MTLQELRDKLFDPDYDISKKGWHIIEVVRDLREIEKSDLIDEIYSADAASSDARFTSRVCNHGWSVPRI